MLGGLARPVLFIFSKGDFIPHRKSLALNWRRTGERYRMEANKCSACGSVFFPPRLICSFCRRKGKIEPSLISGQGEVYSYTVVHAPPEGFENIAPYVLGIIKLKEGPMITAQITDVNPEEVKIGMPVRAELRRMSEDEKDGMIHYSFKFVKAD